MGSPFMHNPVIALFSSIRTGFRTRLALQIEILALRPQLNVVGRSVPSRPKLQASDRALPQFAVGDPVITHASGTYPYNFLLSVALADSYENIGTCGTYLSNRDVTLLGTDS
jgi:hypothetical protein